MSNKVETRMKTLMAEGVPPREAAERAFAEVHPNGLAEMAEPGEPMVFPALQNTEIDNAVVTRAKTLMAEGLNPVEANIRAFSEVTSETAARASATKSFAESRPASGGVFARFKSLRAEGLNTDLAATQALLEVGR